MRDSERTCDPEICVLAALGNSRGLESLPPRAEGVVLCDCPATLLGTSRVTTKEILRVLCPLWSVASVERLSKKIVRCEFYRLSG